MDTAIPQKNLEDMLDMAVREVTEQATGVQLHPSGEKLGEDLCTVYISFEKGFRTSLSLCADTALMARMTQNAMCQEEITPEDLEDFGKEYFNILCGRIAAVLFQVTKVATRFSVPSFYRRRYEPENFQTQFALTYFNDQHEGAQLVHHIPEPHTRAAVPGTL